jgi:hypothetical protein
MRIPLKTFALILWAIWNVFACKPSQDNSIDKKEFYQLSGVEKTLKTREEKCQAGAKQFNSSTGACEGNKERTDCVAKRFYEWDEGKKECVFNAQLMEDYQAAHCAPKGQILGTEGVCIDPPQAPPTSP